VLTLPRTETLEAKTGFQGARLAVGKGVDLGHVADQVTALIDSSLESNISTGIEGFICAALNIYQNAPRLCINLTGVLAKPWIWYTHEQYPYGKYDNEMQVTVTPYGTVTLNLPTIDGLQLDLQHNREITSSTFRIFVRLEGFADPGGATGIDSLQSQMAYLNQLVIDSVEAMPEDSTFANLESAAHAIATETLVQREKVNRIIKVHAVRIRLSKADVKGMHKVEATRNIHELRWLKSKDHGIHPDERNVTQENCDSTAIDDGITSNYDATPADSEEPATVTAEDREPRITIRSEEPDLGAAMAPQEEALVEESATSKHDPTVKTAATGEGGVYVALGSNLGDRLKNIEMACKLMDENPDIHILQTSHLYETEPMYYENQDRFLNGACEV
jgi:hypothetical protein